MENRIAWITKEIVKLHLSALLNESLESLLQLNDLHSF